MLSQAKTATGSLSVTFSAQDYENPVDTGSDNTYIVTVTATHATDTTVTDSASVTVTVTDVDEPPTDITGDAPTAINEVIDESTIPAISSGNYTTTDPEGRGISWSISGSDSSYFGITAGGVLSFSVVAPNYETKSILFRDHHRDR